MIDLLNDTIVALEVSAFDALVLYLIVRLFIGQLKNVWNPKKKPFWEKWFGKK